jgi:hypothetical protein
LRPFGLRKETKLEALMQRRAFLNLGLAGLGSTLAMASPVPQFIPNPSTKKWAILFGTWYGSARDAAIWISEGMGGIAAAIDIRQVPADLNSNLEAVRQQHPDLFDIRPSSLDPSAYDYLVIGTSIHAGKGPTALDAYINKNIDRLQNKIRGHFAVCGNMGQTPGPTQITAYIDNYLAKICKTSSLPRKVFGGRVTKSLVTSAADLAVVQGFNDYDNLKRSECIQLGKDILAATV